MVVPDPLDKDPGASLSTMRNCRCAGETAKTHRLTKLPQRTASRNTVRCSVLHFPVRAGTGEFLALGPEQRAAAVPRNSHRCAPVELYAIG